MNLTAVLALAVAAFSPVAAAQESAPSDVAPLRLPAALYDVVGAWDLGWGDSPGRGRPAVTAAAVNRTVVRGPNGSVSMRNAPAPVGQAAMSQFVIAADSILYRRGADWAEIAVASVVRIEEVRWPEANQRGWVKVTYEVASGEESIFFRQSNATSQATLAATLRKAVEVNRASAGTARE
jgi:uncharacterized protein YgiM (DUF1202 family)